ncbi:MAG TPA: hypothetical protein VGN88_11495 [Phycisphaerae bacterium]|jgi:hypothetical protein
MTRKLAFVLSISCLMVTGCEADDSQPRHPRLATPLDPTEKAENNAEHRALEAPSRELPTGSKEFPGQSNAAATAPAQVATLDQTSSPSLPTYAQTSDWLSSTFEPISNFHNPIQGFSGPGGMKGVGKTTGPTTNYNRDIYPHTMPPLPDNPGTVPMAGTTATPSGDWSIDNSWGQGLVLDEAVHRAWPQTTAEYKSDPIKHNPLYYFNLQDHTNLPKNNGSPKNDVKTTFIEVPWFFVNTAALPWLMLFEQPLQQRITDREVADPTFHGHLPAGGPTVPTPFPGALKWDYPFLNPDGTVKSPKDTDRAATVPATK